MYYALNVSKEKYIFIFRFATYKQMMAFWEKIEPSTHRMICVTSSKVTMATGLGLNDILHAIVMCISSVKTVL